MPAAITHVWQITASYPNVLYSVRYSSVTTACMRLYSHSEKSFFQAARSRTLVFGYKRYSQPTLATAEFFVHFGVACLSCVVRKSAALIACGARRRPLWFNHIMTKATLVSSFNARRVVKIGIIYTSTYWHVRYCNNVTKQTKWA